MNDGPLKRENGIMTHGPKLVMALFAISTALFLDEAKGQPQTGAAPSFDVASVKASDPANRSRDLRTYPGGRFRATNVSLKALIVFAYDMPKEQISGGPPWLDADLFDVDARASGNADRPRVRMMVQSLLAERFQLRAHKGSKEGKVFLLLAPKGASKLKLSTADGSFLRLNRNTDDDTLTRNVPYTLIGQKVSAAMLAKELTRYLLTPVLDRTQLSGDYDLKLDFETDESGDDTASLIGSLSQIGLRLEAAKGPVEILIIESASRPSRN